MDDKLYYVESPEGDVLGPMNMIQVLEGVAAGAVLDDARICEVGGGEWVSLADVAYTHNQTVEEPLGVQHGMTGAETGSVEVPSTDVTEEVQLTANWDRPRAEISMPPPAPHREPAPAPAPPRSAAAPPRSAPARQPRAPSPPQNVSRSASLEPSFPEEPTLVVAPAREPARRQSGDFSLRMVHEEGPDEVAAGAEHYERRRPRWPIAVMVVGALGAIAVVYFAASGTIPFLANVQIPFLASAKPPQPRQAVQASTSGAAATAKPVVDPVEKGWQQLGAGESAAALETLRAATTAQPDNARAHHGLGLAALDTGDTDLALTHLARACGLDDKNAMMHVDLGRAQLRAGNADRAAEQAALARALDPEESAALLLMGRADAARNKANQAVESLAAYVKKVPKHLEARVDLARALASAGRVESAIEEIGPYLTAHPEDRDMQVARLDWMMSVGQNAAAAKLYGPAATQQPDDAFAQYLAGRAGEGTQEGAARLKRAVELDANNRDAWMSLGRTEAALGKTDAAARDFEQAFALRAPSAEEKKLVANLKKKAAAASSAQAAVASAAAAGAKKTTLEASVKDIKSALAREDFRSVRRVLEAAQAELRDPVSVRNLSLWTAIADLEEGKLDKARNRFAALDPSASYLGFGAGAVSNWLGRAQLVRGDVRAAIGAFDQVGPEDPNEYATAQLWEGVALSSLGMQDIAQRTWTRVKSDVPGNVGPTGRAAVKSAEFLAGAIAEKDYRTAVSPVPDFANDMHFFLGWAARTKDADAARTHFKAAVDASRGREFPFSLAEAEISGSGISSHK